MLVKAKMSKVSSILSYWWAPVRSNSKWLRHGLVVQVSDLLPLDHQRRLFGWKPRRVRWLQDLDPRLEQRRGSGESAVRQSRGGQTLEENPTVHSWEHTQPGTAGGVCEGEQTEHPEVLQRQGRMQTQDCWSYCYFAFSCLLLLFTQMYFHRHIIASMWLQ